MEKGCSDHAEISLRRVSDEGSRRPPMAQSSEDGFPSAYLICLESWAGGAEKDTSLGRFLIGAGAKPFSMPSSKYHAHRSSNMRKCLCATIAA